MEVLISGLVLGLLGSFHCIGMCGPIAVSLPLHGTSVFQKILGGTLYNMGRTVTYGLMGAVFGMVGQGFELAGFQKWISIAMGGVMILSVVIPTIFRRLNMGDNLPFSDWVRTTMGKLFSKKSLPVLFVIGLLNGLLPCGLVYLAIAGAIGTADLYLGIAFMVLFGLGTLPMLLLVSLAGNLIGGTFRRIVNRIIPYLVVLIGLLFVLRGLSLGIPYISPPEEKLTPQKHMTSTEPVNSGERRHCCGAD